jgi:hypothetical protein
VTTKIDLGSGRSRTVMALLVPFVLVGIREVTGFVLGLLLFGAHTI